MLPPFSGAFLLFSLIKREIGSDPVKINQYQEKLAVTIAKHKQYPLHFPSSQFHVSRHAVTLPGWQPL